jgi:hypothetical protein
MGFIVKEESGKLPKELVSPVRGRSLFYAIIINPKIGKLTLPNLT